MCQHFPMDAERGAVIDIGTNSVKLLVADVENRRVQPVHETSHQTRLGKGLYENRTLHPDAMSETILCVCDFAKQAKQLGTKRLRIIATSAMRDATNAADLQRRIYASCGVEVEVISGDEEAKLAYRGAATDPALAERSILLLDMGGGSTEMVLGSSGDMVFRQSFPLGTLRLMAQLQPGDNPAAAELQKAREWLRAYLAAEAEPLIGPPLANLRNSARAPVLLVGTGGTATILGRMEGVVEKYDRDRIEQVRITAARLRWHTEHLWNMSLEERQRVPGLPKNRADVILLGAVTYEAILQHFGFEQLQVSTRGLRFAALLHK